MNATTDTKQVILLHEGLYFFFVQTFGFSCVICLHLVLNEIPCRVVKVPTTKRLRCCVCFWFQIKIPNFIIHSPMSHVIRGNSCLRGIQGTGVGKGEITLCHRQPTRKELKHVA